MIKKTPKKVYVIRLDPILINDSHVCSAHQRRSTNQFMTIAIEKAVKSEKQKIKSESGPELDNEFCQEPDEKLNTITDANRT